MFLTISLWRGSEDGALGLGEAEAARAEADNHVASARNRGHPAYEKIEFGDLQNPYEFTCFWQF